MINHVPKSETARPARLFGQIDLHNDFDYQLSIFYGNKTDLISFTTYLKQTDVV